MLDLVSSSQIPCFDIVALYLLPNDVQQRVASEAELRVLPLGVWQLSRQNALFRPHRSKDTKATATFCSQSL